MMRKYITIIAAIALLAGAFAVSKGLKNRKKPQRPKKEKVIPLAFVEQVKNQDMPVVIPANGSLVAKHKVKLFSEVQGVLEYSSKEFKPGVAFKKGEVVYKLNSDEFYTNILAQKSSFQNQIAAIMPDLRIDYPESFEQWDNYLKEFDIKKSLQALPEPKTDKEKLFIAAKNIYTTFYTIKNLEIRLGKYAVYAPFYGVLTEAHVTPGSLVSPGQNIGEFIDPSIYEMEVAINAALISKINKGDRVTVMNLEDASETYQGVISRINKKVDLNSQTVRIFIDVTGKGLKEGMYLKAALNSRVFENVYEVPRNLLVNENQLYVVKGESLHLQKINIIHQGEKTIIVKGLADDQNLLIKPVPKAFPGMNVSIFKEKAKE